MSGETNVPSTLISLDIGLSCASFSEKLSTGSSGEGVGVGGSILYIVDGLKEGKF
jgi:hypothetical protein